jgi:cytochrome P450
LAYLCKYPEVKERLIQEIEQVYGVTCTPFITHESLDKLNYCEAVIHETARISSTFELFWRTTNGEAELGGYSLDPDTLIFTNFYSVNNNKNYWDKPEIFNPDRFIFNLKF